MTVIRVMVVARIRLYREGLCQILDREEGLCSVAAAADVHSGVVLLPATRPTVALVDVPVSEAATAVAALVGADPALKVVAVGVHDLEDEFVAWAEAGAAGYLSCESGAEEVAKVIRRAARGELECPPRIAGVLLNRLGRLAAEQRGEHRHPRSDSRLTRREHEVVELIARGLSNKQIAGALGVSLPTVKNHLHNIYEKLEVHRRGDALARLGRSFTFDSAERARSAEARY